MTPEAYAMKLRPTSQPERQEAFAQSHWWIDPADMDEHFQREAPGLDSEGPNGVSVHLLDCDTFDSVMRNDACSEAHEAGELDAQWLDFSAFDEALGRVRGVLVEASVLSASSDSLDAPSVAIEERLRAIDTHGLVRLSDEGVEFIADAVAARLPLPPW